MHAFAVSNIFELHLFHPKFEKLVVPKFVNKIKKGRKSGREAYGKALDIPNEVSLLSEQSERESAVPKVSKETAREPASKKLKNNYVEFDFEHGKKSIIKKKISKKTTSTAVRKSDRIDKK